MEFFFPTRVIVGRGCVRENAAAFKAFGDRALIVTGRSSAKKCGALDDVCAALTAAGVTYMVFDKIEQNPLFTTCAEGARLASEQGVQFVVGIGGGSPLDASKAIARLTADPGSGERELFAKTARIKALPVVAVGTTAGTGSEVTQVAVITGTDGRKTSARAEDLFPALALGDPTYTEFMPEKFTRSTAADALAHCIESYFNTTATPFSRMYAKEGARLLTGLFSVFPDGAALTAGQRDETYLASLYGGIAISVTGTCMPHQLSYFLTERHGVAHGAACAFWLPEFLRISAAADPALAKEFFSYIGADLETLISLIQRVAPPVSVTVDADELSELSPRWVGNSCLTKTIGGINAKYLEDLLKKTFTEA